MKKNALLIVLSFLFTSFSFSQETMSNELIIEQLQDLSNDFNKVKNELSQQNTTLEQKIKALEMSNLELSNALGERSEQYNNGVNIKWSNGYQFATSDGKHSMKFGGRLMFDHAMWKSGDDWSSGAELRRGRVFASGTSYHNFKYKMQIDFAGGKIAFKDVYIDAYNIRFGHFKQPFSLEALTSSKYITFIERALPNALFSERNAGTMYYNSFLDNKLSFQIGSFYEVQKDDLNAMVLKPGDAYNITGRITYLPMSGDNLLHLGASLAYRNRIMHNGNDHISQPLSISIKPENHLGTKLLEFDYPINTMSLIGTEAAFVMGPFSIQGQYLMSSLDKNYLNSEGIQTGDDGVWNGTGNYNFSGYYGQVSYFLTGETRNYKNSMSGFGRVQPRKTGAVEVAARYSSIKLDVKSGDDGAVSGGKLNDVTIGLNFYYNSSVRLMLNYVMGTMKNNDQELSEYALIGRIQIDF